MTIYETILKRRTVRSFQPRPVPDSILEKVVNSGRLALSAANPQPCEFLIEYWLDEEGNFHAPKRSLKDVFHRNTY